MTIKQANRAVELQSKMADDNERIIFARSLPNHYTDEIDWPSVTAFEEYALTHPNMQDALNFMHQALVPGRLARELGTSRLEQKLCGA